MGARFALVLAALATSSLSAGEPPQPLTLKPTSAWNVHYADDSCRLLRSFGSGEEETIFYAEQFAPGTSFVALVAGQSLSSIARDNARLSFSSGAEASSPTPGMFDRFGPSLLFNRASLNPAENGEAGDDDDGRGRTNLPFSPEQEAAVIWSEVRLGNEAVRLNLGRMDKAMEALRTCTDELVENWGINPEVQRRLTRRVSPASSPAKWIRSYEYPAWLVSSGAQGIVQYRMIVDAEGRPTDCSIKHSTHPDDDWFVCRILMKRARFVPALDVEGKPVASYWRSTVRFMF